MIELRQTTLVEADFTEPFDDRVDILFRELELATKWQCPSLLLAIYSSEFVHGDAQLALENRLQDLGQKAHHIVVKGEDDADIPLLITELKDLQDTIVFVDGLQWGCSQADYAAYRCLDKHREFFIENRIRVVFWLTETEAIHLAHYAPDCWTLRHRVIEFVDAPRLEQIQPQFADLPCAVPDELTGAAEDLDAKISLRAALLTDLPEGIESTAARANLLLTLGILHWRRGDYDQSLQFLNTAMELGGKLQDDRFEGLCFNALALVDSALGKTKEAIQAYTRAVELAPDQITPWANLGHLNYNLEQYPDALAAYQKAVEANPADAASWAGLADTQAKLKNNEDAVFAYRKALELDPQNSHAWISLGDVYTAEGQWDDALAAYQKGIEMEPSNARVWNELGNLHFNAAAHQEALNEYQQALQLGHETHQSCSNLAEIHIREGKFAEAAPLLQKAIELQPEAAQKAALWTRLAEVYRKLNQYDQAIEAYRKADELDLESADTQSMAAVETVQAEPAAEPVVPCEDTPLPEPTLAAYLEGTGVEAAEPPTTEVVTTEAMAEVTPEPVGLIDDSATLVNESEVDFVHWLESLAEKVPQAALVVEVPLVEATSLEAPESDPTPVDPTPAVKEAEPVQPQTDTLQMVEPTYESLPFIPDSFDLFGPEAFKDEEEAATRNQEISDSEAAAGESNVSRRWEAADAAERSQETSQSATGSAAEPPDVSFRLEALRETLASMKTNTAPTDSPVEPAALDTQPTLENEVPTTPTSAEDPLIAEPLPVAPLPASDPVTEPAGSQPSAAPAEDPGDSSTQAGTDPRSAQIWNELGNIYYNIVAYDEAINALNKALELDHSYGWTYNNLASIYIHKGSYAEAIPLLQKGIPLLRDSKDKALLWNRLGDAYRRLDQPDQAAEAYKKAVELDPENVSLLTRARFSLLGNCRA